MVDNILLFGERIIIPETFRKRILRILHKGHQGQQRMKAVARSNVYWPNIDQQIEDYVRQCPQCQYNTKSPTKTSLCSWPISTKPLQRVHIDIAGPIRSQYYLVIVDSFSKWPEVYQSSTISSRRIVDFMSDYTNRFGYPHLIVSDNGTQFVSAEFQQFCNKRGIQHVRTAPYHPQSNGQAERYVDIVKTAIRKAHNSDSNDNTHLQEFLLQYRSTPNSNCAEGKSPAELFIGRKLRTEIELIKPQNPTEIKRDTKMEAQFNRKHGVSHREFQVDQQVFVKTFKDNKMVWRPGEIVEKVGQVNYHVKIKVSNTDKIIKSHANQIRERHIDVDPDDQISYNLQPLFHQPEQENPPHDSSSESVQSDIQNTNASFNTSSYMADAPTENMSTPPRRSTRNKRTPAWHRDYEVHH